MMTLQHIPKIGVLAGLMISLSAKLQAQHPKLSKEILRDIIHSIPSPMELTFVMKDLGIGYNKKLFNPANNATTYTNPYQQALNLGIYYTDLGFAMIYEKKSDALIYLEAFKQVANKQDVKFNHQKIKHLLNDSNSLDSLLFGTNQEYKHIDRQLFNKEWAEFLILMKAGEFLESLYIVSTINSQSPQPVLKDRIGEQKITLEQFLLLLSFYEEYTEIKSLVKELNKLQRIYDHVKIDFQYIDPKTKQDDNGLLIIEENISTKITITKKNLAEILKVTTSIRNKIIQGK